MTAEKGLFPNMSDEKASLISELAIRFVGLVLLYLVGMAWSWYFLREGTSTLGWIIYWVGACFLFWKVISKTVRWFKILFLLFKK